MTAHHESKKGPNPAQVQAPQSAQHNSTAVECSTAATHQPTKTATKTERAYMLFLSCPGGVTEGDILRQCRLSSGRNYATKIERALSIRLHREQEGNPDGIGAHFRYRITSRADAERVAGLVDQMRQRRNAPPLSLQERGALIARYPEQAVTAAA
ncbi:hypothetical protein [Oceanimonas baumannii]|uniref:Uncharacterized protein n=1 Tax=Oceanimonas baumannii TaxID=129578 RepID=A0A235CLW1_9GAMM|nr:hypothetical protein [Oceanimonas baumannii]OYD25571.1 hypothetical protein B6S09_05000 [Oceanimonas baumannii]TDW61219.1 hypothetical protein LY04_00751 [Oceanimonas baumannii]